MGRKPKIIKTGNPKREKLCCQALNKQKPEIENYIVQLIEASEDFIKNKMGLGDY